MKKIINKKTYNTETAIEIASWDNNRSRTDFDFCEEVLYKTKRGDYFLEKIKNDLLYSHDWHKSFGTN